MPHTEPPRLIAGGAVRTVEQRDLAAEARAGGRALTSSLAHFAGPAISREMMALTGAWSDSTIDGIWAYYIDPSIATHDGDREARRNAWRSIARSESGQGASPTNDNDPGRIVLRLAEAEKLMESPIYREAFAEWDAAATKQEQAVIMLAEANGGDPLAATTLAGSAPTRVIEVDWDEVENGDSPEYAQSILNDVAEYGVEAAMGEGRMSALRESAEKGA